MSHAPSPQNIPHLLQDTAKGTVDPIVEYGLKRAR